MVLLRTRCGLITYLPASHSYRQRSLCCAICRRMFCVTWTAVMEVVVRPATPLLQDPSAPTAFELWSEILLPLAVGVGSIATAVVALLIAMRSNKLARAATEAASRSNEIARRANRLEERRDQRAVEDDARTEREALRARWSGVLDRMAHEMQWGAAESRSTKTAREGAQLITEAEVRELFPPHTIAMEFLERAREAEGGDVLFMQASAAAHALMHDWVRDPEHVGTAAEKWRAWMVVRLSEHEDDVRRGLAT